MHLGRTLMVTRTGWDTLPPQSLATTPTTWVRELAADRGSVFLAQNCSLVGKWDKRKAGLMYLRKLYVFLLRCVEYL